ncbi:hypothetical protein CLU79DRAFT_729728 [Phycomyces nitens]|nr:hypothetical protein CLU79DRAFT_729728 [Phycomyces nitens]
MACPCEKTDTCACTPEKPCNCDSTCKCTHCEKSKAHKEGCACKGTKEGCGCGTSCKC